MAALELWVVLIVIVVIEFGVLLAMLMGIPSFISALNPTTTVRASPVSANYIGKTGQGTVEWVRTLIPHKRVAIKMFGIEMPESVDLDLIESLDKRQSLGHTSDDVWIRKDIMRDAETVKAIYKGKESDSINRSVSLRNQVANRMIEKMSKNFGNKVVEDARLVKSIRGDSSYGTGSGYPFYSSMYRRPYSFSAPSRPVGGGEEGE